MTRLSLLIAAAILCQPANVRADDVNVEIDDCLAKAVAQQAPGRPAEALLHDLNTACKWPELKFMRSLTDAGKSQTEASQTLFYEHIVPIAARAHPM